MQLKHKAAIGAGALIALGLGAVQPTMAQTTYTAYDVVTGTTGNQAWTGALGMDFDVNAGKQIAITSLGVFDSGQDGLTNSIIAYIYKRDDSSDTGVPLVSQIFTAGDTTSSGTLLNGSRFITLSSPLILNPGTYSVVAENYGAEPNYNEGFIGTASNPTSTENSGGGLISFTGTSRYSNSQGVFPTTIDGGPTNRYDAGTFRFTATPEPSTLAAFAFTGLGALGLILRARKRRSAA